MLLVAVGGLSADIVPRTLLGGNMATSQRLSRGFHRLALFLAAISFLVGGHWSLNAARQCIWQLSNHSSLLDFSEDMQLNESLSPLDLNRMVCFVPGQTNTGGEAAEAVEVCFGRRATIGQLCPFG
jgi:hypothetical protein